MKLMNDEQILGIVHGIEEGFKEHGIALTESDKSIVNMSVKTTVDVIERLLNEK